MNGLKNKGFTLIEVIVYLSIVSIVSMIAIPSISYFQELKLKVDARNVASDIRYTKFLTIINGTEHKIVFQQDGYKIIDNTQKVIKSYILNKGVIFEDFELNRGPTKVNYMCYNINGDPTASGTLILTKTDGKKKMKLTIVPVTGRVSIIDV